MRTSRKGDAASDSSTAYWPVNLRNSQPLQYSARWEPSSRCRSLSRSHFRMAPELPANPKLPLIRNASSSSPSVSQRSTMLPARPSFQRIAGPVGRPSLPTSQHPSPCAVIDSMRTGSCTPCTTDRTVKTTASHTLYMSCSLKPGARRCTWVAWRTTFSSRPSSSNMTAFTMVVPASTHSTAIVTAFREDQRRS